MNEQNIGHFIYVTKSYRRIPDEYPKPLCSYRTEADQKMLNDNLISVPVGSEDFGFNVCVVNVLNGLVDAKEPI